MDEPVVVYEYEDQVIWYDEDDVQHVEYSGEADESDE